MSGKRQKPQIVGIDTNIFIYHYEANPEFVSKTDKVFRQLEEGTIRAVTSIITFIELLSFQATEKEIGVIRDAFYSAPNLTVFPVDSEIATMASEIRRKYSFRLPDSIQLATSLFAGADIFITNDKRIQSYKEMKVKLLSSF